MHGPLCRSKARPHRAAKTVAQNKRRRQRVKKNVQKVPSTGRKSRSAAHRLFEAWQDLLSLGLLATPHFPRATAETASDAMRVMAWACRRRTPAPLQTRISWEKTRCQKTTDDTRRNKRQDTGQGAQYAGMDFRIFRISGWAIEHNNELACGSAGMLLMLLMRLSSPVFSNVT
ncbi:uncharacterized protein SPSK_08050 [Sporothrix schenckii 1099-18]|uniref:Uncharacterized protein n=1 Tax=Sporothrix schenckii 1099-18 TaxID=1397361 RepID=A0A0F2MJ40_SPOSC|nr:uncharacterized protein SPSK_08050 [Sporothrix schenckii 1099-18]KJR88191.1 hypothetical protein SPSK_08050 [Sporothrix schenckii 1099-18]